MKKRGKRFWGGVFSREESGVTMIGEGMSISGILHFGEGMVRLDGNLEGKAIGQGTLVIGEKGRLRGEMEVGILVLGGRAEGRILAADLAHITSSGKLFGKVQSPRLVIDKGGIFEGEGQSGVLAEDSPEKVPV
jgi:cytoskeletal protein CcmA (bactofilin family)